MASHLTKCSQKCSKSQHPAPVTFVTKLSIALSSPFLHFSPISLLAILRTNQSRFFLWATELTTPSVGPLPSKTEVLKISKFKVSFSLQSMYAHIHSLIWSSPKGQDFFTFLVRILSTREAQELAQGYTAHTQQRWHPNASFVTQMLLASVHQSCPT